LCGWLVAQCTAPHTSPDIFSFLAPRTCPRSLQNLDTPYFYALGADNRLLRVNIVHVVGLLEGEAGAVNAEVGRGGGPCLSVCDSTEPKGLKERGGVWHILAANT